MTDEEPRSRLARAAAERALVRVVHHYVETPGFVLIGGLVPELLCSGPPRRHAGTTDIDVQVDLEIAAGAVNTKRLETALKNAEFEPGLERVWRWKADGPSSGALVKFELLADLDTEPNQSTISFNECEHLGAANLRGTGIATHDTFRHPISAKVGDQRIEVDVEVTGLGGFLLAKVAAAHSRRNRLPTSRKRRWRTDRRCPRGCCTHRRRRPSTKVIVCGSAKAAVEGVVRTGRSA